MTRKDDLEQAIRESYDIIRQYENTIRTSERPEEKARAQRIIQEQRALIEGYLPEYRNLLAVPDDIAQIVSQFSPTAKVEFLKPDSTLVPTRQPFEPEMVLIPAGEFLMGNDLEKVYLPDYYIAKTPITNAQYRHFVQAGGKCPKHWENGKIPWGKGHHPVVYVSWNDAATYCNWLAELTGNPYHLPTEQEWEKAARGTDGRKYPWGDDPPNESLCNFDRNVGDTTPVGRYSPQGDSLYGCVDMAGNVWEWVADWYDDQKKFRVLRGGSWYSVWGKARCSVRSWQLPDYRHSDLGFRCVSPIVS